MAGGSTEECPHLIALARNQTKRMQRRSAVGVGGGDRGGTEVRDTRESYSSTVTGSDPTVASVLRRVAMLLSAEVERFEPVQVGGYGLRFRVKEFRV